MSYKCECGNILIVDHLKAGEEFVCPSCSKKCTVDEEMLAQDDTDKGSKETLLMAERIKPTDSCTAIVERGRERYIQDFKVLQLIGKGGMGWVYKCYDDSLDRIVALKVISKDFAKSEEHVKRFKREAKSAAKINHPNIVTIYSIGKEKNNHFFAMEYIEGNSLDKIIRERGKIPQFEALEYVIQAAEGLRAAHTKSLIHRDIKPSNIIIGEGGRVKVADFGLAKPKKGEAHITQTGTIIGTPYYMSPEQGKGLEVDEKSDIYSLGATFFHLLSGRPPYQGDSGMDVVVKHITENTPNLKDFEPEVDDEIAQIINKMMQKEPKKRYQDYETLINDLILSRRRPEVPAGFWIRSFAFLFDYMLLIVFALGISTVIGLLAETDFNKIPQKVFELTLLILGILYFSLLNGIFGRTMGKMVSRIIIVNKAGGKISLKKATVRALLSIGIILAGQVVRTANLFLAIIFSVLGMALIVGMIVAAFLPSKRGLHDLICKTKVIYKI